MNATTLAPYAEHVVVTSYVYVVLYSLFVFFNIFLIFVRRNRQPVKIRSPQFIIFHLFSSWTIVTPCVIRLIVGSNKFPCVYYILIYGMAVPMFMVPSVVRMYSFILIFRVSHLQSRTTSDYSNRIKRIKRLMSPIVLWLFIGVILLLHLFMWIGTAFLINYTENVNLFSTSGCGIGKFTYLPLAHVILYALILFVLLLLLIGGVRDTYGIRYETVVITTIWVLGAIGFAVFPASQYPEHMEKQFPAGYILFLVVLIDIIITSTIPVILSFQKKYRSNQQVNTDVIRMILEDDKYRAVFKDYAVRSICAESIMFWEDAQEYKKIESNADREDKIEQMYSKYLEDNAPYELNIPSELRESVYHVIFIKDTTEIIEDQLLGNLEIHCITDMGDVFSRFAVTKEGERIVRVIKRELTELRIMEDTGMVVKQGDTEAAFNILNSASSDLQEPLL